MSLTDFSTDALLAELVRRRSTEKTKKYVHVFCESCTHFKCVKSDKVNPCQKRHVMLFKIPDDSNWPNPEEWGHYRRGCVDFEAIPEVEPTKQRPTTFQQLCDHNERLRREAAVKPGNGVGL